MVRHRRQCFQQSRKHRFGGFGIVTQLVDRALQGDTDAYESLRLAVYDLILEAARCRMRGERKGHTFQVTALANEIWKKLDERKMVDVLATRTTPATKVLIGGMIKRFIIDHGRRRRARLQRDGKHQREAGDIQMDLDLSAFGAGAEAVEVETFTDALDKLAEMDADAAETFNLRVFAGLDPRVVAEWLNHSVRKVQLDYKAAKLILAREIQGSTGA